MNHPDRRIRRRRRGFTLVELMVALAVGGIAISTFYTLARGSNRFFQEQARVANMQDRLRHGIAQVKRDLRRAGYMALGNLATTSPALRCTGPMPPFTAAGARVGGVMRHDVSFPGNAASGIDPAGLYGGSADVRADRLWLLGNFETYSLYGGVEFNPASPGQITLRTATKYMTNRDFGQWQNGAPTTLDGATFNTAFRLQRPIALMGPSGVRHLAVPSFIGTGAFGAGGGINITFAPAAIGASGPCDLQGGWIAPLEVIEYQVLPVASAGTLTAARDLAMKIDVGDPLPQLHRREIDLQASAPMAGGEDRVVLDYVVAFHVDFLTDGGTQQTNDRDNINWVQNNVLASASPQTIRGARILLATRAPGHDATLSEALEPLQAFRMAADRRGAARVRTLRADVFMPNIATVAAN